MELNLLEYLVCHNSFMSDILFLLSVINNLRFNKLFNSDLMIFVKFIVLKLK